LSVRSHWRPVCRRLRSRPFTTVCAHAHSRRDASRRIRRAVARLALLPVLTPRAPLWLRASLPVTDGERTYAARPRPCSVQGPRLANGGARGDTAGPRLALPRLDTWPLRSVHMAWGPPSSPATDWGSLWASVTFCCSRGGRDRAWPQRLRAWLALVLFWSGADPRLRDRHPQVRLASTGRGRRRLQRG
jgi:hypothetical protein